jgi:hypothetical protein
LATQANLLQRVYVMRAASSRIWFTIPNSQQADHCSHSIDHSQADDTQPTNKLSEAPEELKPIHQPPGYRRYRSLSQLDLVDGYTRLVTDRILSGWSCHLVTILFSQLPGPRNAVIDRMKGEVQRIYSTLVTRVHRKPRTAPTNELPLLVGAADLPVYKRDRSSAPKVFCNGGLHLHALVLIPPVSRLKESLTDHFDGNSGLYAGSGNSVRRIDVRPVIEDHGRVVDYVLKTTLNGRLSYDEAILVLPRARGELVH